MTRVASIEEAVQAIAAGGMVILVDDEDRENEGDLVIAAERVTPQALAFMVEHGRGLICLAMEGAQVDRLGLQPMAHSNQAPLSTAFTESIDAADAPGSGVSATARAQTIRRAIAANAEPSHFRTPGHVFPLRARAGGVLVRSGQTEGSVDLARLAGLHPSGVICEVLAPDGTMLRLPGLLAFGARHGIPVCTVADLIEYRMLHEPVVEEVAHSLLPTPWATFDLRLFRAASDASLHVALTLGQLSAEAPTLVRVHRANLLGDAFGLQVARGRSHVQGALARIAAEGAGAFIYLGVREGANELAATLRTYVARQAHGPGGDAEGSDKHMDFYEFGMGAQILRALGLGKLRVLTNSPRRLRAVSGFGLEIVERLPLAASSGTLPPQEARLT